MLNNPANFPLLNASTVFFCIFFSLGLENIHFHSVFLFFFFFSPLIFDSLVKNPRSHILPFISLLKRFAFSPRFAHIIHVFINIGCKKNSSAPLPLECPAGTYGPDCGKTCSVHCADSDHICNKTDGSCDQGCKPGYQGHFCSESELR